MIVWLEAAAARLLIALFRALGPVRASNLGGALARTIGPWLPVSRVAHVNLALALPHLSAAERQRVVRGAWDNLGRTMGEFPHVGRIPQNSAAGPGWELAAGADIVRAAVASGGPAIFFSGHIGNWEMLPVACAAYGAPFASMFRAATNPKVDALVIRLRREATGCDVPMFAKGAAGAKAALGHLRRGGHLGLLMDQKLNDGVQARLFGHPAMTAPAMAQLALRFGCPVIPGRVERIGPARFRLFAEPPLPLPNTGNRQTDVMILTQAMNDTLERWIRARPESWLWMHRRWPKEVYKSPEITAAPQRTPAAASPPPPP